MDEHTLTLFLELHADLPRQAPGSREATLRALALFPDLPPQPRVLDLGCGPGAQSLVLAEAAQARITAVDMHRGFLVELATRAAAAGLADRITPIHADMSELPPDVPRRAFDLAWSEGAVYSIGFDRGLRIIRDHLVPGGGVCVSELSWLVPPAQRPAEVTAFWTAEYAAIREVEANTRAMAEAGFEVLEVFTLPDEAWWTEYYAPLEARLEAFLARHPGDPAATAVAESDRREMALHRAYAHVYGYVFYCGVLRRE